MAVERLGLAGGVALLYRFGETTKPASVEAPQSKPAAKKVLGGVSFSADKIGPGRRQELEQALASMTCTFTMKYSRNNHVSGTITRDTLQQMMDTMQALRDLAVQQGCGIDFTATPADSK